MKPNIPKIFSPFTLALLCFVARTLPAQDVHVYEAWREEYFTQATTNRAALNTAVSHNLGAEVLPGYSGAVISAALKIPQSAALPLTDIGNAFVLENSAGNELSLPAPAPTGIYQFQVNGASQGTINLMLNMPGPALAIAPMRIANYSEAQAIDAAQTFTLRWDKTIKSGTHDYLRLHIFNSNGTLVFSQSNIDLGTTNLDIPAGTLQPNDRYTGYLAVLHVFTLNNTKQPFSESFERKLTRFTLRTLNPAGVISFSASVVSAAETEGSAYFTMRRAQGTTGTVTVDYFTEDATAHSNVNYTAVSGTLTFGDGVTSQTFAVPLLNDGPNAGPVMAHVTLTNVTGGAGLATRPHACLTIRDSVNNTPSGANAGLLAHVEFYAQTTNAAPVQTNETVTSRFYAEIQPRYPGGVSFALLLLPNGNLVNLSRTLENFRGYFVYSQDFPSAAAMNAAFKPGKATLIFESSSGLPEAAVLNLGAEKQISTPYLINWTQAQTIDPTADFGLKWAPFTGASSNDYVRVIVEGSNSEYLVYTPTEFEAGALPGSSTTFTIPANTLSYGNTYTANIIFARIAGAGPQAPTDIRSGIASVHTTVLRIKTMPPP